MLRHAALFMGCVHLEVHGAVSFLSTPRLLKCHQRLRILSANGSSHDDGIALIFQRHCLGFEVFVEGFLTCRRKEQVRDHIQRWV